MGYFFIKLDLFGIIDCHHFFEAKLPNTVKKCCCQAIDCEDFFASIPEIDHDEHLDPSSKCTTYYYLLNSNPKFHDI